MHLKSASAVLLALFVTTAADAQVAQIPLQTISPDQYRVLPTDQRQLYVAGALDGIRGINPQTREMFNQCLQGMTLSEVTQVVDHGLSTLEPVLRSTVPVAVHNALLAECERRGFQPLG